MIREVALPYLGAKPAQHLDQHLPQPKVRHAWIVIGIIAGGRLGYVFLYRPVHYLQNPWDIPALWEGGMSFHGGFLGLLVAITVFSWRNALPLGGVADAIALASPPAILLGRIANYINAELWGRPTSLP